MDIARFRKHSVAVLAAGVLLAGCSASRPAATSGTSMPTASMSVTAPSAPVSGDQVSIDGFAFVPATLKIKRAPPCVWPNRTEDPPPVPAGDVSFLSPGMGTGPPFPHPFPAAG